MAAIALACLHILLPRPAAAAGATSDGASPWDSGLHSAVRLIAAGARQNGGDSWLRAGVEIQLDPGWKTYWRYPGDSGVPPRFDFAGSQNVKRVTVDYPAPHRFADESGQTIGYKGRVILPFRVQLQDAGKPAILRLDFDYAVCEKLCIPAQAKLELALAGTPTAQDAALSAAEAQVPARRNLGEGEALSIAAVRREAERIVVDVTAPPGSSPDLFAEGPTPDWALPLPEPIAGAPAGAKRFAFVLDGLPPGATPDGALLTLTAVAGEKAIEVPWRLP